MAKLSHNLGLADSLDQNLFEILFATSERGKSFLVKNSSYQYRVLPQLWELNPSSHFINTWFDDPNYIEHVYEQESELINCEKPDFIVGNVSFTSKLLCQQFSIPLISVLPPIMSPGKMMFYSFFKKRTLSPEVSAKMECSINKRESDWWIKWGNSFEPLCRKLNFSPPGDVRNLLNGDYNIVHSFPEYDKVSIKVGNLQYSGPLLWSKWSGSTLPDLTNCILCTFGTKSIQETDIINKTIEVAKHFSDETFIIHTHNAMQLSNLHSDSKNIHFIESYNPNEVLPHCKMVFCQGGYSLILLCFLNGIPILSAPFQIEQMYHSKIIEDKGIGICLTKLPTLNDLRSNDLSGDLFLNRIHNLSVDQIKNGISTLLYDTSFHKNATTIASNLSSCKGCETINSIFVNFNLLNNRSFQVDKYNACI